MPTDSLLTDWRAKRDRVRDDLAIRNAQHEPRIWLLVGEREAYALAAGLVPKSVRAMARTAVDWEFTPKRRPHQRRIRR